MEDGNTAALSQKLASDDRADRDHRDLAKRAIDDITETLMHGGIVGDLCVADFMDVIEDSDIAGMRSHNIDDRIQARARVDRIAELGIRTFLTEHANGMALVDEKVAEMAREGE